MAAKLTRARIVAGAVGALVALGVVAHLPGARTLLGRAGGCPMLSSTPAERDAHRVEVLAPLRGTVRAPSRSALGLNLGESRSDEIESWATRVHATCAPQPRSSSIQCRRDDASSARGADLVLQFDSKGILQGIDVLVAGSEVDVGAERLHQAATDLQATLGPPTATSGEPTATFLRGSYQRADIRYRFQDYAVDLSATNLGKNALVLREQYRALPN